MTRMSEVLSMRCNAWRWLLICGVAALISLVAFPTLWMARVFRNAEFVENIRRMKGDVYFENSVPSTRGVQGDYSDTPTEFVAGIPVINGPLAVDLSNVNVNQFDWKLFSRARPPIELLQLPATELTGSILDSLEHIPELKILDLTGASLGKGTLRRIVNRLDLESLRLTQADLQEAELTALFSERNLRSLYLSASQVTSKVVSALRAKMPWCDVVVE